jgi:hypothetical protein
MPHYYFDSRDGETLVPDHLGWDFPGLEAARDQAALALAELAKDVLPGCDRRELAIEVRDAAKEPVLRTCLTFEAERLR